MAAARKRLPPSANDAVGRTPAARPTHASSAALLVRLGAEVRAHRTEELDLSAAELARRAGLSVRFLLELEAGRANISVERLADLARAMHLDLSWLFRRCEEPLRRPFVALLGIRGAGKSTVGERLAKRLGCPFYELDGLIEEAAGQSLATLFDEVRTPFSELEARVLARLEADAAQGAVLAVGGSIVDRPDNLRALRRIADTVWLKAAPKSHWERVRKQGDRRPMQGRADARAELDELWNRRRHRYERADLVIDTDTLDIEPVVERLHTWLRERRATQLPARAD